MGRMFALPDDPELLKETIRSKGVPIEPLKAYIDAMRHGMPPHGGGGVGLERVYTAALQPPTREGTDKDEDRYVVVQPRLQDAAHSDAE